MFSGRRAPPVALSGGVPKSELGFWSRPLESFIKFFEQALPVKMSLMRDSWVITVLPLMDAWRHPLIRPDSVMVKVDL